MADQRRRVRDSYERRRMLHALAVALEYHERMPEALEKADIKSLHSFWWWLGDRRCKICARRIPPANAKCCSRHCARILRRSKRGANQRRRGALPWIDFRQAVIRPVLITVIADKLDVTVEEAQRRALADARRGRLIVYRTGGRPDAPIREVGQPYRGPCRSAKELQA
jgi:predicted nucleic acid-binding Zn ribbon protein